MDITNNKTDIKALKNQWFGRFTSLRDIIKLYFTSDNRVSRHAEFICLPFPKTCFFVKNGLTACLDCSCFRPLPPIVSASFQHAHSDGILKQVQDDVSCGNSTPNSSFLTPNYFPAFTLAEVLITLGIIGIIASMTIPTLMNSTQDKEFKTKLLKEYSTLSQVQELIAVDNGGTFAPALSGCGASSSTTGATCMKDAFKAKLNYVKECAGGLIDSICFPTPGVVKFHNGIIITDDSYIDYAIRSGLILSDGTSMAFYLLASDCGRAYQDLSRTDVCGLVTVDVNGLQKPNTWGKDIYEFFVYANQILPMSTAENGTNADDCGVGSNKGYTCATKYLMGN